MSFSKTLSTALSLLLVGSVAGAEVSFSRDIRPILSARCFACHGPDSQERDADYRLDTKDGAFADLGGYFGLVPGKPMESEVFLRITSPDEEDLMPPPKHKNPITESEIVLLRSWIEQGAPFAGHWAFQPVERPSAPGIDDLIGARLKAEGLALSREAPPETLLRRLHLDLTGLPPSLEEVDAFLKNPDKATYEAEIDRLMASPQFAERLALEWLDVARYADTNGYSIDDHRDMWAWRDWVIDAFQRNLPYNEFIEQQLAGDLMENATDREKIATGFLRNSMNTHEGGTIAEEYRVASIADKIDTVSTAFLGITMKCAQCHDHKYDPISQRDYYRFFAFFNTSTDPGKGATNGNTKPLLEIDPLLQDASAFRASLEERIAGLQHLRQHPEELLGDARATWEAQTLSQAPVEETTAPAAFPVPGKDDAKGLSWIWSNPAGSGEFAWFRKTLTLPALPAEAQLFVSCDNEAEIWVNGKRLGKNPDWRTPTVLDLLPLLVPGENVLAVAAKDWEKGGSKAALLGLIALTDTEGTTTYLGTDASWTVSSEEQENWTAVGNPFGFVPASVVGPHGTSPWGNVLALIEGGKGNSQAELIAVLRKPDPERSGEERDLVAAAFAKADGAMGKLLKSIDGEIGLLKRSLESGRTSVMIMDEGAANRKTPILERGAYDKHGEIVEAGIPTIFGDLPEGTRADRLALARWITDPAHPLTARVTVNRYWQMLFGTGLVKTTEDFGSQGDWPSHPELLDWLAAEFVASGWDVRALLKTMLLSQTYRQSSHVSEALLARDPYNRLLARAPRYRLSAEAVRDSVLAVAGLLDRELGGPSVYPPQPVGLWKEVSHFGYGGFFSAQHYYPDRSRQVFRRSLYTFWKRTSPPPVMTAFDAPNRETCAVRRTLTNTPLQALVLMNAPQFVEASRGLADRMLASGKTAAEQIKTGFRLATGRRPSAEELQIFQAALERQRAYFTDDPSLAHAYLGPNNSGSPADHAALVSVASLILNLDETITRE